MSILYIGYIIKKKKLSDPKGAYEYPNDINKLINNNNNNIHENKNVRYCNLKCTIFVPNFPKI